MSRRPVALAKTSRPKLFGIFPRERLFRLVDEARQRPVVWIAAQPGAGKTSLVSGYLEVRAIPAIWYQIDGGDADPATFFYYLRQAASAAIRGRRIDLPLLTPEYLSDLTGFVHRYFRELFSRLSRPTVLVFDNYQEVPDASSLHTIVQGACGKPSRWH